LAADESKAAISLSHRLQPIVEPPRIADALGPILSLARRHTLTAYDASYLELAFRSPLATPR
jgi:predicted nucleic acid-binding protein